MTRGPTPEEFFAQKFAALEKVWDAAKHLPALYDAIVWAHVNSISPPEWAVVAVLNLIVAHHNATSGKKRLRSQYALDYIHRTRWRALSTAFRMYGIEKYEKTPGRPKDARVQEARQQASEALRKVKSVARGRPRQIQDSFDKVEKARGTPAEVRYFFDR
ncbi:MAG TPA: hypothetical protein VI137_11910 [Pseudolabrys sp.]|jgi:hypothetical protein